MKEKITADVGEEIISKLLELNKILEKRKKIEDEKKLLHPDKNRNRESE